MNERIYDEKTKSFKEKAVSDVSLKVSEREKRRLKKLGELGADSSKDVIDNLEAEVKKLKDENGTLTTKLETAEKEKADIQNKLDDANKELEKLKTNQ